MIDPSLPPAAAGLSPSSDASGGPEESLREAARAFEAAFLAEMLKHGGLGETPEAFGGGAGEGQFAGLLREAQARQLAEGGGLGLAEYIVTAMKRGPHAQTGR